MAIAQSARPMASDTGEVLQVPGHSTRAVQTCRFCSRGAVGDVIDAGGDVGKVHRACFVEWDRRQEALEAAATITSFLPDPGEIRTELEMEEPVARAA